MKSKKFILTALIIFWAFQVNSAKAFTIEKNDDAVEGRFVVSPARIDYSLAAGDSINIEMMVVNRLGERKDFFVKTGLLNDRGDSQLDQEAASWFEFEKEEFALDQGERARFNVKINAPRNANSAGYYQSILVGTKGDGAQGKDKIKVVSQVGVPVLLTVGGENIQKKAQVKNFISDRLFYRNGPVKFISSIENQGDVHLQLNGEISIHNITGAKIGQLPLKEWILLPGAKDEQIIIWTKKWLLGKYRADARFFYDDGKVLGASYSFYAFPWHVLLLLVVVLVLLYFAIRYLHSRYEIRFHLKNNIETKNKSEQEGKPKSDDQELKSK